MRAPASSGSGALQRLGSVCLSRLRPWRPVLGARGLRVRVPCLRPEAQGVCTRGRPRRGVSVRRHPCLRRGAGLRHHDTHLHPRSLCPGRPMQLAPAVVRVWESLRPGLDLHGRGQADRPCCSGTVCGSQQPRGRRVVHCAQQRRRRSRDGWGNALPERDRCRRVPPSGREARDACALRGCVGLDAPRRPLHMRRH